MFVQVIHGKTANAEGLHQQLDKWQRELSAGATGWLGSTAGVTSDGEAVAYVRFDTAEHAQQNSGRPEQDAWWHETEQYLTDAKFAETTEVSMDTSGNPDDAKFVQVIEGKSRDPHRIRELMSGNAELRRQGRPDILGAMQTEFSDGSYAAELFFTSEAEAREGERKERPPQVEAMFEEINALAIEGPRFYDLTDPWIYTPTGG